jgi:hypothetical protein
MIESKAKTELDGSTQGTRARRAALSVAGFLAGFLVLNTYWGLGGRRGVAWVLGCDCTVPLSLVWIQEAALAAGVTVVLAHAGIFSLPLPPWIPRAGIWVMAAVFAAVGFQNLLGDNTLQARFLFAPLALALSALSVVVARQPRSAGGREGGG